MSFTVARVSGGHREMGRALGEICAQSMARTVDFYASLTRRHGLTTPELGALAGPYVDVARSEVPELVQEVEGMAEGAGIDTEAAWMMNCFEELWESESCTTMATGRFFMHAEQWFAEHSDIALVIAIPGEGPAFISPTCTGFLPAVGLNATGFAQGIDSLHATDERVGTPRCFVARRALGAPSVEEAMRAATTRGRAGGYAHFFSTIARTLIVETSAANSELIEVGAHTNHYQAQWLQALARPPSSGSLSRLVRACDLIANQPPLSLQDCARLLADHGGAPETICMHERGFEGSATVFGFAADLQTGRCIVSDGPPCEGRWHEFELAGFVHASAG